MAIKQYIESAQQDVNESKSKMDALLAYANGTTGQADVSIGDAIKTLCDGYGQGSGDDPVVKQLLPEGDIIPNYYLNKGVETQYNGWSISRFYPIPDSFRYIIFVLETTLSSKPNSAYCALYNENKEFLDVPQTILATAGTPFLSFDSTGSGKFIRISLETSCIYGIRTVIAIM